MKVGALCAGYGGIELGLSKIVKTELAWVSEIEPNASRLLQHRYGVPNHGDLTKIGVEDEVLFTESIEPVDIITAGFPCQPFSVAGDRKGVNDERWLIDDVCRIARITEAKWLILENVRGILTANSGNAIARVCAAMAYNGFSRWEWGTLRASDIGAPHKRDRWFCIATNTNSSGWRKHGRGISVDQEQPAVKRDSFTTRRDTQLRGSSEQSSGFVANSDCRTGQEFDFGYGDRRWEEAGVNWVAGDYPERRSISGSFSKYEQAIKHWEQIIGRRSPQPSNDFRLNHWFVEWMMGLPPGWVCGEELGISRTACLKMLGNGVIPQQAAVAISTLLSRF